MKKFLSTFITLLIFCGFIFGQKNQKSIMEIRQVLDSQVIQWNNGNIEGFMEGYWKSDDLVFVSGDSLTKGWQSTTERYKKNYNTRAKMGVLSFSEFEINVLEKKTAVVTGRWKLTRQPKDEQGRFTLIFRKFKEGWRIIHDHTS